MIYFLLILDKYMGLDDVYIYIFSKTNWKHQDMKNR